MSRYEEETEPRPVKKGACPICGGDPFYSAGGSFCQYGHSIESVSHAIEQARTQGFEAAREMAAGKCESYWFMLDGAIIVANVIRAMQMDGAK